MKLIIIGEATANISKGLQRRYASIPWSDIKGLRDIAVHAYHRMEWDIVWTTATKEVPELRKQIAAILEAEYGGEE